MFEGTGMCIFAKRLSRGRFTAAWERTEMTMSELALFLEGTTLVGRLPLSPPAMAKKELFVDPDSFS